LALNFGCFILNIFTAAIADKIGPRKMVLISYFLGFFVIMSLACFIREGGASDG
jgi:MFS family permease